MVIPSIRVTGMSVEAGLIPSATLNDAAMVSPWRYISRVPPTRPISTRPIWVPPSMKPGVTHLPVASIRVASAGIVTLGPTATTRPFWMSTVACSSLGPETG